MVMVGRSCFWLGSTNKSVGVLTLVYFLLYNTTQLCEKNDYLSG